MTILIDSQSRVNQKITTNHWSVPFHLGNVAPILIAPQSTRGLGHRLCEETASGAPHGLHADLVIGFFSDSLLCRAPLPPERIAVRD